MGKSIRANGSALAYSILADLYEILFADASRASVIFGERFCRAVILFIRANAR